MTYNLREEINEILKDYVNDTQIKIENELSWTSNLKYNISVFLDEEKNTMELDMPSYGIFVDRGRKPGKQPPLNVIYNWCQSKGIDTKAAFPIARKIGKKGLPAHPFLDIFTDNTGKLIEDIGNKIADFIQDSAK